MDFISDECFSKACNQRFSKFDIMTMRNESLALDYYDEKCGVRLLPTVILGNLRILRKDNTTSTHARTKSKRQRPYNEFMVRGVPVCRKLFFFVHYLTEKKFKRLMRMYWSNSLTEVVHGNRGRRNYWRLCNLLKIMANPTRCTSQVNKESSTALANFYQRAVPNSQFTKSISKRSNP